MLLLILELALALVGVLSAGHALLHKRDPRAAWGWVAVCLMFPGIGAALYWLMGVNRIRTRARHPPASSPCACPTPWRRCSKPGSNGIGPG